VFVELLERGFELFYVVRGGDSIYQL